jgi:hypothetical protein
MEAFSMLNKTGSRTKDHDTTYYLDVLKTLINARKAGATYAATADILNAQGLLSHTGLPWTQEIVRQTLKKIRNKEYAGKLYRAMLSLIYSEALTIKESLVLFTTKRVAHAE